MDLSRRVVVAAIIPLMLVISLSARESTIVHEVEPNDDPSSANPIEAGDTAAGSFSSIADMDWFAIDLEAGSVFDVMWYGESPYPSITVVDSAGTQLPISSHSANWIIETTGRYYVGFKATSGIYGGYTSTYLQEFLYSPPGPGDPTTSFAGFPTIQLAAGSSGEVYGVSAGGLVYRLRDDGSVETLGAFNDMDGLAVDAFGGVLLAAVGGILRLDPETGAVEVLSDTTLSHCYSRSCVGIGVGRMVVDSRGDIWAWDRMRSLLWHFDPYGALLDTIDVRHNGLSLEASPYLNIADLQFSPSGVLHIATGRGILQVDTGTGIATVIDDSGAFGIAFDAAGNIYALRGGIFLELNDRITLLDSEGNVIHEPFAQTHFQDPYDLVFMRDASGEPTRRLIASGYQSPFFVEPKASAVAHPGAQVGARLSYIGPGDLPIGDVDTPYEAQLTATMRGVLTLESGSLPPGLTLAGDGLISGVPAEGGVFHFVVRSNAGSASSTRRLTISIKPILVEADIMAALLGGPAVGGDVVQYLDDIGNRNGMLDLGDVSLWMDTRQ